MASVVQEFKRNAIKTLRNKSAKGDVGWILKKFQDAGRYRKYVSSKPVVGKLYTYVYDAKYKDVLPYWDKVPLMMPIHIAGKSMLGLNFHYLSPKLRLFLMTKLLELNESKSMTERTKIDVTYGMLKGYSRFREFRPTIHRYLFSHLKSKILVIPANEWYDALLLPTAHFTGAGRARVYKESRQIIKDYYG